MPTSRGSEWGALSSAGVALVIAVAANLPGAARPGQARDHLVEEVVHAAAVFGRNLHDRVEAQLEELDGGFACDADVCLVHDGDHGLAERPDLLHDVEIARDEAGLAVEHDQHEIGLRQRPAPLLNHEMRAADPRSPRRGRLCRPSRSESRST